MKAHWNSMATTAATCHSIRFAFAGPSFLVQQENKIKIKSQSQTLFASKGSTVSTVMTCLVKGKKLKNKMKYIFTRQKKSICKKTNRQISQSLTHRVKHRYTHFYVGKDVHYSEKSMHLKLWRCIAPDLIWVKTGRQNDRKVLQFFHFPASDVSILSKGGYHKIATFSYKGHF